MQDTTTLPISPTAFWLIVILSGIAFAALLATLSGKTDDRDPTDSAWSRFLTRVGLAGVPEALALFISLFWLSLALTLAGGIIATILTVPPAFNASTLSPNDTTLRWTLLTLTALTGALGAVVALPFTLIRIRQTQRQTDLQDESLFNDKINAAATDLAAMHEQTQVAMTADGEIARDSAGAMVILKTWEDDLVTRAAAIDRLEGLAQEAMDRDDYGPAQRVARMLSIYVQELSRAHPAQDPPEGALPEDLRIWAYKLSPVRTDMERAAQSLGRINPSDDVARTAFNPKNINLRRCNLQGFDLNNSNFQGADLSGAQLQGANLSRAQMQEARLIEAQMQGADLRRALMQGANLMEAQMQGANLFKVQMQEANLMEAQMQGANLCRSQMQGTNFSDAQMQGADLGDAQMSNTTYLGGASLLGIAVRSAFATNPTQLQAHSDWDQMFHPEDHTDFITQWRAFAADLDPPVTIAPDYRP